MDFSKTHYQLPSYVANDPFENTLENVAGKPQRGRESAHATQKATTQHGIRHALHPLIKVTVWITCNSIEKDSMTPSLWKPFFQR